MFSLDKLYFMESIGETMLTPPLGIYVESYLNFYKVASGVTGLTLCYMFALETARWPIEPSCTVPMGDPLAFIDLASDVLLMNMGSAFVTNV